MTSMSLWSTATQCLQHSLILYFLEVDGGLEVPSLSLRHLSDPWAFTLNDLIKLKNLLEELFFSKIEREGLNGCLFPPSCNPTSGNYKTQDKGSMTPTGSHSPFPWSGWDFEEETFARDVNYVSYLQWGDGEESLVCIRSQSFICSLSLSPSLWRPCFWACHK